MIHIQSKLLLRHPFRGTKLIHSLKEKMKYIWKKGQCNFPGPFFELFPKVSDLPNIHHLCLHYWMQANDIPPQHWASSKFLPGYTPHWGPRRTPPPREHHGGDAGNGTSPSPGQAPVATQSSAGKPFGKMKKWHQRKQK